MTTPNQKTYLGDGVYAELDADIGFVITTENGIEATNRIVLDWDVLMALLVFLKRNGVNIGGV
jgi:hypothetical protein